MVERRREIMEDRINNGISTWHRRQHSLGLGGAASTGCNRGERSHHHRDMTLPRTQYSERETSLRSASRRGSRNIRRGTRELKKVNGSFFYWRSVEWLGGSFHAVLYAYVSRTFDVVEQQRVSLVGTSYER